MRARGASIGVSPHFVNFCPHTPTCSSFIGWGRLHGSHTLTPLFFVFLSFSPPIAESVPSHTGISSFTRSSHFFVVFVEHTKRHLNLLRPNGTPADPSRFISHSSTLAYANDLNEQVATANPPISARFRLLVLFNASHLISTQIDLKPGKMNIFEFRRLVFHRLVFRHLVLAKIRHLISTQIDLKPGKMNILEFPRLVFHRLVFRRLVFRHLVLARHLIWTQIDLIGGK